MFTARKYIPIDIINTLDFEVINAIAVKSNNTEIDKKTFTNE